MSEKTFSLLLPSCSIACGSTQEIRPAMSSTFIGIGFEVEQIILLHAIFEVASL